MHAQFRAAFATFLLAALLTGGTARAATAEEEQPEDYGPFARGVWTLTLSGAYITPTGNFEDPLANVNVSAGYFFWNTHELALELSGYVGNQDGDDDTLYVGAIGFLGRWHFLRGEGGRWSAFIDGGVAASYADQNFPTGGTNFNFISKAGLGATYMIDDGVHLIGGARYMHVSNARIRGDDENPGYDGVQLWAGVMWTW